METEDDSAFTKRRLETHFVPQHNVCAERYRFRSRTQQESETVLQWVSSLRQLASTCEYGTKTDEFIRDQVIEKTSSTKLRQRLLMEGSALTLEKTLTISETLESSVREARVMEASASRPGAGCRDGVGVNAMQQRPRAAPPPRRPAGPAAGPGRPSQWVPAAAQGRPGQRQPAAPGSRHGQSSPAAADQGDVTCFCCGRGHKANSPRCPARGQRCHNCGKLGHFARLCNGRSSAAGARVVSELQVLAINSTQLTVPVHVGEQSVDMVVDTGSSVSILPRRVIPKKVLRKPDRDLCAYGGSQLQVLGKCDVSAGAPPQGGGGGRGGRVPPFLRVRGIIPPIFRKIVGQIR